MAGEAIAAAAREADPLPDRSRAAQFISDPTCRGTARRQPSWRCTLPPGMVKSTCSAVAVPFVRPG
jgi:hypothetical protein